MRWKERVNEKEREKGRQNTQEGRAIVSREGER